mgnify:CR=1 FL=1
MSEKKKGLLSRDTMEIITVALKLMLVSLVVTAALAVVNEVTKDKIAAASLEAKQQALEASLPGASFTELSAPDEGGFGDAVESVYTAESGGTLTAYAAIVKAQGFGGEIRLLVLANADTLKILSVTHLSDSETPGIGTKVFAERILSRYKDMTGGITFSENPAVGVQAVSGATITSKAVLAGVNGAMDVLKTVKGGGAGE